MTPPSAGPRRLPALRSLLRRPRPNTNVPLMEAQFDGLVGPTHNYAGLSFGNVASAANANRASMPRAAALQGIGKMRAVMGLGIVQGVLPPHERPHLPTLRSLGFTGRDDEVLMKAWKEDPILLAQCSSASVMWTANAATVSPSPDTADGKLHFTPANLKSMFHRSIEPPVTARILQAIFADERHFAHHPPLPCTDAYSDEGAANHTRLFDDTSPPQAGPAVHLFVYGQHFADRAAAKPSKFPARQTLEACQAVARLHGLDPARTVYAQQHPEAVDAGAFHNDVVCVGTGRVLFYHELAFADEAAVIAQLRKLVGKAFIPVRMPARGKGAVSLEDAVKTYLFNSQLFAQGPDQYGLVAPSEVQTNKKVRAALESVLKSRDNPMEWAVFMDVRESMRNGGGPACLRLRVPMTGAELAAANHACIMDETKLAQLEKWVDRWYPDRLKPKSLADPRLLRTSRDALDALTKILNLGPVYDFQR